MYSVFYNETQNGFFQLKTDFKDIEEAEMFIQSDAFRENKLKFQFLLKEGNQLIKGRPLKNDEEHFRQAMKFAVDIPKSKYL